MAYTTHGLMTPADMADYRDLYDMEPDLCPCCESAANGNLVLEGDPDVRLCPDCGHEYESHA